MNRPTPPTPVPAAEAGAATRKVFVRALTLDCSIGVHPHERGARQRVRIDIELTVRDRDRLDDDIANVVSYDDIVDGVKAIIATGHFNLVETLADRIGESCVTDSRVIAVRVRVEKLDAIAEAAGVGVEIERLRTRH